MFILIFNIGSSTIKYELFSSPGLKSVFTGIIDKITKNHERAIKEIFKKFKGKKIACIGHRVVHGGTDLWKPTIINEKVIKKIKEFSDLAPLHNPANLAGILACRKLFPRIPQIAVFDTGFHHTIPEIARIYALPRRLASKFNIQKYGFHGISSEYVYKEAKRILGPQKTKKTVICHLGNGCSITAVLNGKSIDTSMGFTPMAGAVMGTRPGDIDPGIPLFLLKKGFSPKKLDELLNHQSGLLGLSGISSDMRVLRKKALKGSKNAKLAIEIFSYCIAKLIAGGAAALNGLDAIVFTGGIGENAWYVRKFVCEKLKFLNAKISEFSNRKNKIFISSRNSKIKLLVIKTDEEKHIADSVCKIGEY